MIVQLSSGQGPSECELAVLKLYEALKKEYPDIEFLSAHEAREKGCYTSIIFTTERDLSDLLHMYDKSSLLLFRFVFQL